MKRFLAVILLLTITLTGCQNVEMSVETSGTDDFGFSFEVARGSFKRGGTIEINVSLTNQMDESYKWHGSSLAGFCAGCKLELIHKLAMDLDKLTPDNNGTGKMDQGEVVGRFLFKTNQ